MLEGHGVDMVLIVGPGTPKTCQVTSVPTTDLPNRPRCKNLCRFRSDRAEYFRASMLRLLQRSVSSPAALT